MVGGSIYRCYGLHDYSGPSQSSDGANRTGNLSGIPRCPKGERCANIGPLAHQLPSGQSILALSGNREIAGALSKHG